MHGSPRVSVIGLRLPEVAPGDDIVELVIEALRSAGLEFRDGDVLAVTSKVLSKALGLLYRLDEVEPSDYARRIAERSGLDPRVAEIIVRESDDVVAAVPFRRLVEEGVVPWSLLSRDREALQRALEYYPTVLVTLRDGMLWSDSGVDTSNHPPGVYSVPPRGLDAHARRISAGISERTGRRVAVVVCDTEITPWGALDVARGAYGIPVVTRRFGMPDSYGKPKFGGADNVANAVCAVAGLVMGQHGEGIPAVLVRGLEYEWSEEGVSVITGIDLGRALWETIKHTLRVLGPGALLRIIRPRPKRGGSRGAEKG